MGDPGTAFLLSIGFLAGATWILVSALSDPDAFFEHRRSTVGFVAAPLLVLMFGLQAFEAIGDLARQRDSVPVFHRLGWWFDRRGLPLIFRPLPRRHGRAACGADRLSASSCFASHGTEREVPDEGDRGDGRGCRNGRDDAGRRPEPPAAINDVLVQVHASGFVPTEMAWPSTWTDRRGRDRTPSIPGHELAGVVSALGYGTTGLSVGQRVLGLADWHRDGTLAEYVAIEARNLAPLPGDVDFTVGASLPISGLTAWQGLFDHGRLQAGQSVLAHGAAGAVGTMVTQLAREAGAYVIGTGRAADRQKALDFGAHEFVDLENDALEDVGGVDLVFDVIGGDIQKRSASLIRAGGTLVSVVGPAEARPADGLAVDFVVESDRAQLGEIVQRVRDGRLRTNIGNVATLDDAVAALNPTERPKGKTIIRVRP